MPGYTSQSVNDGRCTWILEDTKERCSEGAVSYGRCEEHAPDPKKQFQDWAETRELPDNPGIVEAGDVVGGVGVA